MCLLWGTNWVFVSHKTTFFVVTAVKPTYRTYAMQFLAESTSLCRRVSSADALSSDAFRISSFLSEEQTKFILLLGTSTSCYLWTQDDSVLSAIVVVSSAWVTFAWEKFIGLYLVPERLTAKTFRDILTTDLPRLLGAAPLAARQFVLLARRSFSAVSECFRQCLNGAYPGKWGLDFEVRSPDPPPRSTDLISMNFLMRKSDLIFACILFRNSLWRDKTLSSSYSLQCQCVETRPRECCDENSR
jgi:hypothetical protein